jgi:GDPmannose 4,6-dehydratase
MSCKGHCACSQKKAIITGVTGQDGSHLADLLLEKGYKVFGLVRRSSTYNSQRITHLLDNPNFKVFEGDITDYSSIVNLLKVCNNVSEFYNLAAQSHVAVSFKQPGLTWDITAKGCLNILQAIVDLGLTQRIKFYQASSSEMFGKSYDIIDNEKYQNENTKFLPQSPYAIAKCAAHEAVRLYREAYGVHASAGILFNHEGPRRGDTFVTKKITKWIGDFFRFMKQHGKCIGDLSTTSHDRVYITGTDISFQKLRLGNLEAFRDWGYAGNYVEAMWMMLQQEKPDDYVICTGETHTIQDFLDVAFNYVGINNSKDYVMIDPAFYRPSEVDYLRGDNTKAKLKLGWQPTTSFKELVEMMLQHDLKE